MDAAAKEKLRQAIKSAVHSYEGAVVKLPEQSADRWKLERERQQDREAKHHFRANHPRPQPVKPFVKFSFKRRKFEPFEASRVEWTVARHFGHHSLPGKAKLCEMVQKETGVRAPGGRLMLSYLAEFAEALLGPSLTKALYTFPDKRLLGNQAKRNVPR